MELGYEEEIWSQQSHLTIMNIDKTKTKNKHTKKLLVNKYVCIKIPDFFAWYRKYKSTCIILSKYYYNFYETNNIEGANGNWCSDYCDMKRFEYSGYNIYNSTKCILSAKNLLAIIMNINTYHSVKVIYVIYM